MTTAEFKCQTFKLRFGVQQGAEKEYFGFQFGNYTLLSCLCQSVNRKGWENQFREK